MVRTMPYQSKRDILALANYHREPQHGAPLGISLGWSPVVPAYHMPPLSLLDDL